jgi:hypothetical protein
MGAVTDSTPKREATQEESKKGTDLFYIVTYLQMG